MSLRPLPLFQEKISTAIGQIWIWKIVDPEENDSKVVWQKKEVVRMLQTLGYSIDKLLYKPSGQPGLMPASKDYLSISHSQDWFAIYIASEPVGIDIEVNRDSIEKGREWFMNAQELSLFQGRHTLQLIWGAKEAYYKKREGNIADLRNDVTVKEINNLGIKINHEGETTTLLYRKIENVYIVWTLD
jgi:4'-phosphopantetheinyl transferase